MLAIFLCLEMVEFVYYVENLEDGNYLFLKVRSLATSLTANGPAVSVSKRYPTRAPAGPGTLAV
jgi:hypothetical protein